MKRRSTTPLLLLLAVLGLAAGQSLFHRDPLQLDVEYYCKGRSDVEFFRRESSATGTSKRSRGTCNDYYRCVPAAGGTKAITKHSCQQGMSFDIELQICQINRLVDNCAQWEKYKPPQPRWPLRDGEITNCEGTDIECGDGECLPKALFCDSQEDCLDGSDENACGPESDPNPAEKCNPTTCKFEEGCFCSIDGTGIPGGLLPADTPQMIMITFSGAVNEQTFKTYDEIFKPHRKNKGNGCSVRGTFFVAHSYTNYSAVQELNRMGHEIAVNSISNGKNASYWSTLSEDLYYAEFEGGRVIAEKFANITIGDIIGMRVPMSRTGGNEQYRMMNSTNFVYDSSISAPRNSKPLWPYNLKFRMPHKCIGTSQNCPSKSMPIWEMVLNELDRRENTQLDEPLTGCHYVDSCNINDAKTFRKILDYNLNFHYSTNRAPFGLHFTAAFFETRKPFLKEFIRWIHDKLADDTYYFVTMTQALNWIANPTPVNSINNFQEWKEKCEVSGQPYCSIPNPCGSRMPRLFPREDRMYLHTCIECPYTYPWLWNPEGNGLDDLF